MNSQLFYRIIAWAYDLLDVIYFRNWQKSPRRAVLEHIEGKDILDLCTGTATTAMAVARKNPEASVTGIDLSEGMLQVARRKIRKAGLTNLQVHQMDATRLSFPADHFDRVLISLVLHELDDNLAAALLTEAKRVLKDDGEMLVTEWESSRRLSKRLLFAPIGLLEPKPYRKFIKTELHGYFTKHGLIVREDVHCDYTRVLVLKKA